MKVVTCFLLIAFVAMSFGNARQQKADNTESCGFRVEDAHAKPAVTGPDDIVPLVYVVEQPDSPIEITSLDFEGTWLSVLGEQFQEKTCVTYKVRNRSGRAIPAFNFEIVVNGIAGGAMGSIGRRTSALLPGQAVEVKSRNGGGSGAPGNRVRLVALITTVDLLLR